MFALIIEPRARGIQGMSLGKTLATPLRQFFNPRFEALVSRLTTIDHRLDLIQSRLESRAEPSLQPPSKPDGVGSERADARLYQAGLLERIDVRVHNIIGPPPTFETLVSQAASASQCDDRSYLRWATLIEDWHGDPAGRQYNRKLWEWAFILEAAQGAGLLEAGKRALGFGVGSEPMPAVLAAHGVEVLATDQGWEAGADWATFNELMGPDLTGLSRPHIVDNLELARLVHQREVDMNAVPADLGEFDLVWSSCVIEHLGSPERGLDFVVESCRLLKPGGIAVHTTELELTPQTETRDYGHCAVYRISDLQALQDRFSEVGCESAFNFGVSMDRFEDRWVSLAQTPYRAALPDGPHLKLAIGDSISTSFGVLIRKVR